MALIDRPEAARRLARAIASDLSLYNEEKVVEGIKNDDFFTSLTDEIKEGRDLYDSRVSPDLRSKLNFFERAVVDLILKPKAGVKSKIW